MARTIRITIGDIVHECAPSPGTSDWLPMAEWDALARKLGHPGDRTAIGHGVPTTREVEPHVYVTSADVSVTVADVRTDARGVVADYVHPVARYEGRFEVTADYR